MAVADLRAFARRYANAWCSQDAKSVASFFSEGGSLSVNDDPPAVGRLAITEVAQAFMTAFPDMRVSLDDVQGEGGQAVFKWTLTGTNTGPGGTGKSVRISGQEAWRFGADRLIAESIGTFNSAEYARQLAGS